MDQHPAKLKKKVEDFRGTVWHCMDKECGSTKPRWEDDLIQHYKNGIFCICGTRMIIAKGTSVKLLL